MPNVDKLSDKYLLLALAEQEDIIAVASKARKELLEEIRARREFLKDQYRRGEFQLERND